MKTKFLMLCLFILASTILFISCNKDNNSDSGISPNDSEVEVLIPDRKCDALKSSSRIGSY